LMLENPTGIVDGLRAVMRALNVGRGVIAIEDNKPDAIRSMRAAAFSIAFPPRLFRPSYDKPPLLL
ncbi:MAG: hypothetical protein IJ926_06960, partial [Firmicutes bacterium]|nr:hypothetical protein [Bacillota bacterium]